jgi:hypothetical protein
VSTVPAATAVTLRTVHRPVVDGASITTCPTEAGKVVSMLAWPPLLAFTIGRLAPAMTSAA